MPNSALPFSRANGIRRPKWKDKAKPVNMLRVGNIRRDVRILANAPKFNREKNTLITTL